MDWLDALGTLLQFLAAIGALPLAYWWIRSWREAKLKEQELEAAEQRARRHEQEMASFAERREVYKDFLLALDDFLVDRETGEESTERLKDLYFRCVLTAGDDTVRQLTELLRRKLGVADDQDRDREVDRTVAGMRRELNRFRADEFQLAEVPVSLFMRRFAALGRERALAPERAWVERYLDDERRRVLAARGFTAPDLAELLFGDRARAGELPGVATDDTGGAPPPAPAHRAELQRLREEYAAWRRRCVAADRLLAPPPPPAVPDVRVPPFRTRALRARAAERIDWGLHALGIPELWRESRGRGVKVAILDTGIDVRHPDLRAALAETRDFTGSERGVDDVSGHGTHCAGIIGARANGLGVVGVAPECELYVVKVLGDRGFGSYEQIVQGLEWALLQQVDIISMSLGGSAPHEGLQRALRRAVERDLIVICAAGNDGVCGEDDCVSYPGAYPETISVGSVDRALARSRFSSVGATVEVCAPGEEIDSTFPPAGYATLSGTSMATPFVAGVAALILAKHRLHGGRSPCRNQEHMRAHLLRTATDRGAPGRDPEYGFGIVHPGRALADGHPASTDRIDA